MQFHYNWNEIFAPYFVPELKKSLGCTELQFSNLSSGPARKTILFLFLQR